MIYEVVVANGERIFNINVIDVEKVTVQQEIYALWDANSNVLFSAPVDSVLYIVAS